MPDNYYNLGVSLDNLNISSASIMSYKGSNNVHNSTMGTCSSVVSKPAGITVPQNLTIDPSSQFNNTGMKA